jgi:hypothetical protein
MAIKNDIDNKTYMDSVSLFNENTVKD